MTQNFNDFTTIIVGNGLGMSIDPEHFTIERGLKNSWEGLDEDTQKRIKLLITDGNDLNTEDQLDKHYEAIQACLALERLENSTLQWLHEDARDFPFKFHTFIKKTAWHFFNYPDNYNDHFNNLILSLRNFIISNHAHLITLNYDKLLYGNFSSDSEIMRGYNGKLVDGFYTSNEGFDPQHLIREYDRDYGWYLHLHGSPLFYTDPDNGTINKRLLSKLTTNNIDCHSPEHVVLCNTKLKTIKISQSFLLHSYWNFFDLALRESKKIVLFGYSGKDIHLNEKIQKNLKEVIIVEYADPKYTDIQRQEYWSNQLKLSKSLISYGNLIRLPSILDYRFDNKF